MGIWLFFDRRRLWVTTMMKKLPSLIPTVIPALKFLAQTDIERILALRPGSDDENHFRVRLGLTLFLRTKKAPRHPPFSSRGTPVEPQKKKGLTALSVSP